MVDAGKTRGPVLRFAHLKVVFVSFFHTRVLAGHCCALLGSVLSGSVLSGSVLSGSVLSGSVLSGSVLSGSVLSSSVLFHQD
ncbi:hypothetical protein FCN77_05010 [Arthrobacter sp. 24S4-2]|uniref:pentapeptide repeat-containing protein n=1 Tax=Arthrobacter sp. 24S4-2 TaxID=2575374 RepID=UPI0010C7883A|nr:hypothetical protein FCN77_05010 [Arthrobacter sp. 24S4-2]